MTERTLRVLVADDEADVRLSLRGYLEDMGYAVVEAADGETAVEAFRVSGADIVLLDLRMPRVDGLQALARIREMSTATPAIVISGAGTMGDVVEALRLGAWDYLTKPIEDMELLGHALRRAVERMTMLRERDAYQERLEREVARQTDELRQAHAAKDEFLARLSHELRTPLTPVLLTLSAMKMDPALSAEDRENAASACRYIEMEARLIDDLLDLTRVLSRTMPLQMGRCDVHGVIQAAAALWQEHCREKGVDVELALGAFSHELRADASRLQQAFWILIGNAQKFTPAGGRVTIRTRNEPGRESVRLVVEVRDTGIGMSPETLGHLFRPFDPIDRATARKYGGLGVGLVICKAIVELHGGTIEAASGGVGQGSSFTVCLPVENAGA